MPAMGNKWRTLLAVLYMSMSFFKSLLIAVGKSFSLGAFGTACPLLLQTSPLDGGGFFAAIAATSLTVDGNRLGNANMGRDANSNDTDMPTNPNHHAPTHRGSVGEISGSIDKSA